MSGPHATANDERDAEAGDPDRVNEVVVKIAFADGLFVVGKRYLAGQRERSIKDRDVRRLETAYDRPAEREQPESGEEEPE